MFNSYSVEVVQWIGYDSFPPDNGVLIAKNKDREGNTCGYNCFTWVIDAHPEDISLPDFVKPDGTRVMRTAVARFEGSLSDTDVRVTRATRAWRAMRSGIV